MQDRYITNHDLLRRKILTGINKYLQTSLLACVELHSAILYFFVSNSKFLLYVETKLGYYGSALIQCVISPHTGGADTCAEVFF